MKTFTNNKLRFALAVLTAGILLSFSGCLAPLGQGQGAVSITLPELQGSTDAGNPRARNAAALALVTFEITVIDLANLSDTLPKIYAAGGDTINIPLEPGAYDIFVDAIQVSTGWSVAAANERVQVRSGQTAPTNLRLAITDPSFIPAFLSTQPGGDSVDNPINIRMSYGINGALQWNTLLGSFIGKTVALDLSDCLASTTFTITPLTANYQIIELILPNTTEQINGNANFLNLYRLTIPASVTSIAPNVFNGTSPPYDIANDNLAIVTFLSSGVSVASDSFQGNLATVYGGAGGGAGTYIRSTGGGTWTKR